MVWGKLTLGDRELECVQLFSTAHLQLRWVYSLGSGRARWCDAGLNPPRFCLVDFCTEKDACRPLSVRSTWKLYFKFWTNPALKEHWGCEVVWDCGDPGVGPSAESEELLCTLWAGFPMSLQPHVLASVLGLLVWTPTCHPAAVLNSLPVLLASKPGGIMRRGSRQASKALQRGRETHYMTWEKYSNRMVFLQMRWSYHLKSLY